MANANGNGTSSNNMTMKGLPPELIDKLMAKTRTRNTYGPKLFEFMESDEAGINPREVWPTEFRGKAATTLYQGFLGAAKKAKLVDTDNPDKSTLWIKQSDDEVFILNREKVAEMQAEVA